MSWVHECRTLLNNNWVSTLNAAMRAVARRDGLPLLDLETLHLQLPAAHCYMIDGIHPLHTLLVSVSLNLVLNMYEQSTGRPVVVPETHAQTVPHR